MIRFSDNLADADDAVDRGDYTQDSRRYKSRVDAYNNCEKYITTVTERITNTKNNIASLEDMKKNAFITPRKENTLNDDGDTSNIDMSREFDSEDDGDLSPHNPFADDDNDDNLAHEGVHCNAPLTDDLIENPEVFD